MSTYIAPSKHPETGDIRPALWMDDHFGNHNYGVKFAPDSKIWEAKEIEQIPWDDPRAAGCEKVEHYHFTDRSQLFKMLDEREEAIKQRDQSLARYAAKAQQLQVLKNALANIRDILATED